ncbi:hypothetical protein IW150_000527 [Coemansia sp. RSA 2607]|nr:hypothetical protein IW150_000527 [Coemansia sp. RSA 2607]
MNGARGSDVTVNYNSTASASAPAAAPRYSFCGIVEAEDLPALEAALDGRAGDVAWPVNTDPESDQQISSALYRALFPLLPQLSRALVRTIANWSPAERELGQRTGGVAGVQVSEATCLGIVAYPAWDEHITATAAAAVDGAASASPLGGSNVKRLSRAASSISVASTSAHAGSSASGHTLLAEVSARLLTQYAQWRTVGRLLMRMLLGLQANHVLQADYFAQLLMNENFIPAVFWWLGTADLTLCAALPLSVRTRCFTAEYARARAVSDAAADRTAVGADASDSGDLPEASNTTPLPCSAALSGLSDTLRSLRRLTSHNGLRKGLLYKNKALFFYTRLTLIPHLPIRRITAELLRDIMPVVGAAVGEHSWLLWDSDLEDTLNEVYTPKT